MADVPERWMEAREKHYERWLGPCATVYHEIIPQVPHIDTYIYPFSPERGAPLTGEGSELTTAFLTARPRST